MTTISLFYKFFSMGSTHTHTHTYIYIYIYAIVAWILASKSWRGVDLENFPEEYYNEIPSGDRQSLNT
jgi:hypothetical protein